MEVSHYYNRVTANTGNSWTLATRLGDMIYKAEQMYGQRDQSWTVLGVEFGGDIPRIWFPQPGKSIVIKLATNALDDSIIACYQLAHECIHLLAPCGSALVPVIEEGLATVFSEDYVAHVLNGHVVTDEAPYINAAALVRELLTIRPNAILRLREIEPAFTKMTPETFRQAGIEDQDSLIEKLLAPF
ncbi:hypothetical protein PS662_00643 [Pseudomonas fluorescens]|uniref:Uncharacterized protein n=1 Tax=Pseudomonas fluorescens TaxID=294 RepID=A0A5E6PYW7_PSEFL|nr:hypothetical protein [Pseudomonas fluorescens]VVM48107.1 hypothetical protein PS662_00643 [Pseudomonas fluorescens]